MTRLAMLAAPVKVPSALTVHEELTAPALMAIGAPPRAVMPATDAVVVLPLTWAVTARPRL
ncbi:MAG TPA: hypothetical protein VH478_18060 [Trebonia sp.]|nr:hypothetical protein [Trebonia sp.]